MSAEKKCIGNLYINDDSTIVFVESENAGKLRQLRILKDPMSRKTAVLSEALLGVILETEHDLGDMLNYADGLFKTLIEHLSIRYGQNRLKKYLDGSEKSPQKNKTDDLEEDGEEFDSEEDDEEDFEEFDIDVDVDSRITKEDIKELTRLLREVLKDD